MIDPERYKYVLPPELVAQEPATPRDSSKLLVYDTTSDTVSIDRFFNLNKYVPENSFLVLNKTKVLPSRIYLYKENGGKVKTLFLVNELKGAVVKAMLDRYVAIGQRLHIDGKYWFKVVEQDEHIFSLLIEFAQDEFIKLLYEKGSMPIPPYLKKSTLTEDELRVKYQTIFAEDEGSAAAPTASLHFTKDVFEKLEKKGIKKTFVKLHVGAGTFAPLLQKNIDEEKLHTEWYEVSQSAADDINLWKKEGRKLIAVGTTVTRTLETVGKVNANKRILESSSGETDIFIFPPFHFRVIDCLMTNFHVPKSSLMMLVDAFLQDKHSKRSILELYEIAIKEKFRFFSFGDSMLII